MNQHLSFLILLLAFHITAIARQTGASSPASAEKKALMERLVQSKADTSRVHALRGLALFHRSKDIDYDSVVHYSSRAFDLARQLKYEQGIKESADVLCRAYTKRNEYDKARSLLALVNKEQQAMLLVLIGEGFLFEPALKKANLDTSFIYFTRALQAAKAAGSAHWKYESLLAIGKYHFSSNEFPKGKESLLTIIRELQQTKDLSGEAHYWSELGKYMPDTDSTVNEVLWAHGKALQLYQQLKDTPNIYSVMEDIGATHMFHSRWDMAKAQYLQVIDLRKRIGNKKLVVDTRAMALLCLATGDLEEALQWALATERNEQELNLPPYALTNILLGLVYAEDGQHEMALSYFLGIKDPGKHFPFLIAGKVVEQYIRLGQPARALAYLQEFETRHQPRNPPQQETIAAAKGDIYKALQQPALAEANYRAMIELDKQSQAFKAREVIPTPLNVSGADAYIRIARFYVEQGRYAAAAPYLATAAGINAFSGYRIYMTNLRRDRHWLQYKVDSAAGNFRAALDHQHQYMILHDSISNAAKMRRLNQLQVQYETKQKEATIEQRGERIQFLEQNDRLQKDNLQKANMLRNTGIAGTAVFLVLAALFYRQYRQKQRANQLVTTQNDQLQHLLTEKEWLLKEVHHRVKNNLQTITCLLESQAVFLENDALKAIESSQHRIYAMSLIHQKLYRTENVKTIEMNQYLPEFIGYLKDSFGTGSKILFRIDIEPVSLDVSVAIPIALILNEAITNSIKYAFPGNQKGTIGVAMYHEGENVVLSIADDGIGMDTSLAGQPLHSLGMDLMNGLAKEIHGQIKIDSDGGTRITLRFGPDPLLYPTLQAEKRKEALV